MAVQIRDDEPAADADGQDQHGDQQAERELQGSGRLGESRRIEQIDRDLPMRQGFADFCGDERVFPIRLKQGRLRSRTGVIVE